MKKRVLYLSLVLALLVNVFTPMISYAESTNRPEVRAKLAEGGWSVVYGDLINEADYALFIAAVASAVVCECPMPIYEYFDYQLQEQLNKIKSTTPDIAQDALIDLFIRAFNSNGQVLRHGKLEVSADLATYKRWEEVVYDEPRTYECWYEKWGIKTKGICTRTERVRKEIPLPNNFQPYFRFRWASDSPSPSVGSSKPGLNFANHTSNPIWVVVGYKSNGKWVAEGWWKLEPGETRNVLSGDLKNRYYYYYANSNNGTVWKGEYNFWIHPTNAFGPIHDELDSSTAQNNGYERKGFREIDTGESTTYTLNLTN